MTIRAITISAIVTGLLLAMAANAYAGECLPTTNMYRLLSDANGERRVGTAKAADVGIVEVWANEETGTFTILLTVPSGLSCIGLAGHDWQPEPTLIGDPV